MVAFRRGADGSDDDSGAALEPSMAVVVRAAAVLTVAVSALGVLGLLADFPALERIIPGTSPVRFNAAVAAALLAVSWFVPKAVRALVSSAALVIAALTVFESLTRLDLGIDHWVVDGASGKFPGRTTLMCSVAFVFVAVAQLGLIVGRTRLAQRLAVLVLLLELVILLGLSYSVSLSGVSTESSNSAVSLALLSVACLAAIPEGGLSWAATGQDPGATLIRRLAPLALIGFPILGVLCVVLGRAVGFNRSETPALIVVLSASTLTVFAWTAARRVARVDRGRAQAIAELTDLRLDLERQVQERASQLQKRRNEIAVLEDRQRIAADLHDIVIQRLFAAGMYLQSGAAGVDEETRRRLNSAAESMDEAIRDLRTSIFELGGPARVRIDILTAISDICVDSAYVLGFAPKIVIADVGEDVEPFRDDILAVIREALANVGRHAGASAVDIVLRVGDGRVWLTVTDNGKGMTETSRRSGTRNMAQRAREFGGDCKWSEVEPSGTRVLWWVPIVPVARLAPDGPPVLRENGSAAAQKSGTRRPAPTTRQAR